MVYSLNNTKVRKKDLSRESRSNVYLLLPRLLYLLLPDTYTRDTPLPQGSMVNTLFPHALLLTDSLINNSKDGSPLQLIQDTAFLKTYREKHIFSTLVFT